jgi:hypothetical protein
MSSLHLIALCLGEFVPVDEALPSSLLGGTLPIGDCSTGDLALPANAEMGMITDADKYRNVKTITF